MKILRHLTAAGIFTSRSREIPPLETTRFSLVLGQLGGTHSGNEERKLCKKRGAAHISHYRIHKDKNCWNQKNNGDAREVLENKVIIESGHETT